SGRIVDRWRWRRIDRTEHGANPRETGQELWIALGVARRERRDVACRAPGISPEDQRPAVGRRRAGVRIGPDDLQAVALEAERPDDRGIDSGAVRERRPSKAGREIR